MQKINRIHYALFILGLSGASLAYSATPEDFAAALNLCQERFNTSDKDECQKLVENKILTNMQDTFNYLLTTNFGAQSNPEDQAKADEQAEETRMLSKLLTTLRNDQLTPEMTFQCYTKLLIRTIERCNKLTDATEVPGCIANGWIDDFKMMTNTPDAIRIGKTPFSIQMLDMMAAYSETGLENEIRRLEMSSLQANQAPLPVDTLKELLEAVKATRAKFVTIVPAFQFPKTETATVQDSAPVSKEVAQEIVVVSEQDVNANIQENSHIIPTIDAATHSVPTTPIAQTADNTDPVDDKEIHD